jgi:hypothetical protein
MTNGINILHLTGHPAGDPVITRSSGNADNQSIYYTSLLTENPENSHL